MQKCQKLYRDPSMTLMVEHYKGVLHLSKYTHWKNWHFQDGIACIKVKTI